MWKIKNSLNNVTLKYFILFSIYILSFLWLFESIFFKPLYKAQRINDIEYVSKTLINNQFNPNFQDIINESALDASVCIEINDKNYSTIFNSSYYGKGCSQDKDSTLKYKFDFSRSNKTSQIYEIDNKKEEVKTVVYAIKLQNEKYAYISSSITPSSGTETLIRNQLIIMTIIIIILSFILAYYISNKISNPIKKITEDAKSLAKGDYIDFTNESKILELEELKDSLNYAKDELRKTEEYRKDLMANVSHDLKTPLTMIKAYAEMSTDLHANNKKKQKEDINIIISEVDRLTLLVNDILTLSKIQSNIETLNKEEFDLIELTKEIIKNYSLLEETENYKFIFNHNKDIILINADKQKINQVLYNLINNAINYTGEDNTIKININENKETIKVEIIDTGKGIKKEDIPFIWDKYYKNKKEHKRNKIGTGLGLSIVKNILTIHNYEFGVNSKKDKGSNFYFIIKKEL